MVLKPGISIDKPPYVWEHIHMKKDRQGDKTAELKLRITPDLKERIRKLAAVEDIGMSAVVRKAVEVLEKQARTA